jgi:hypothetical protein
MLLAGWLFVGCVAVLVTVGVVLAQDDGVAIVGGALGTVLWAVWTFGAFDVEVASGGVTLSFTSASLAIVGVACGLVPAYIALTGPIELAARAREGRVDEL